MAVTDRDELLLSGSLSSDGFWKYIPSAGTWVWLSGTPSALPPVWNRKGIANITSVLGARTYPGLGFDPMNHLVVMAGGFYADIWIQNQTFSCSCDTRSVCAATAGAYECLAFMLPDSLAFSGNVPGAGAVFAAGNVAQPSNTAGGQQISFLAVKPTPGVTIQRVNYGNPQLGLDRYSCWALTVSPINATVLRISCILSAAVGTNLLISLYSCPSNPVFGCYPARMTGFAISYPPLSIPSGTLRFWSAPDVKTQDLAAINSLPVLVAFDCANVSNATDLVTVRYGPTANPAQYSCILDPARTTPSLVVCLTQLGSQGLGLRFTVSIVSGSPASVTGTDTLNFATQSPIITRVSGCTKPAGNGTADCLTTGTPTILTLVGVRFFEPLNVLVNGRPCLTIRPTSAALVQCQLPAGTGTSQSVVLVSAGLFSSISSTISVSYARPVITYLHSTACANGPGGNNVTLINCNSAGAPVLTLTGSAFGATGASVFVGSSPCSNVQHDPSSPHSIVRCQLPPGQGASLSVQLLQANGQLSLSSASVSYPQCAAGTYTASATVCSPCTAGRYTAAPAQTVCSFCDAGRFANVSSSRACTVCPRGRFQAATGRSLCEKCLPGRFARTTQSVSCDVAAPGFFASGNSSFDQVACPPGQYSSLGATVCLDCPINTIAAGSGSASCTKCSSTEVSNGQGAKACIKCPAASHAQDGVCVCDDEFYAAPSPGGLVCLHCPSGAVTCVNGRVINPEDSWVYYGTANGSAAQIFPCPPDRCKSASTCTENRLPFGPNNALCGKCMSSNYTEVSGTCVYCPHANGGLVVVVLVVSWLFVLVTHVLAQETNGLTKIFLFWVQTLLIIMSESHSAFNWLSVFSFAPQTSGGAVCIWPLTPYEQLGVSGVFPLVFFAQLGATCALHVAYHALRAKYRNGARPPIEWTPWIRTAVVLSLSCYTQVTNNVLLYLQCVDIGASKVVFSVPAIDCSAGNSKYIGWLVVAVLLLIVFVIGLPAMILVFLCRNRWHLENDEDVAGALGPLFEPYRKERYYMEPVVLLRRTLMVVLNVALVLSPRWRYTSFVMATMAFLLAHSIMSPFRTLRDNRVETFALVHLVAVATLLTGQSPPLSPGLEILLSIVVLVPALLLIAYVVLDLVHKKIHITRLAWLFPAAAPAASTKAAASKLSASSATASPASAASAAPAGVPSEGNAEEEDGNGIEMQWAHATPPQA